MGLYDYVKLNHSLFGEDRGHVGQCKCIDPLMEDYEINESGRLLHIIARHEDQSDPKAKDAIGRLEGSMTPVPTGEVEDMNWHGYIWVWGNGDYKWRCKFTDGVLVGAEKVAA